ncbi:MAG: hypothetical protein PHG94_03670 [Syntrophomonas sp.]|uniref:hypothetical protein n=1 Tax=Syntrophomonas sp. TaxID=2053627 RepID=UPI002604A5D0|nr:hypothetical protein [Syntrophomonas sp.]MDD2510211.1 hypothetical protein [Syntrophomonas sp.]MDD4626490.1 hypothetical protein [Syntrophomonas sp.]
MLGKQGMIRYVFTSSNTDGGYCSFMPKLLEGLQKIFILKGPSGTGKSSFLRLLGQSMAEKGYEVEMWLSALDPVNPEGLYLPQLEIAVVNGSLPQAIDPGYPAGRAEIINLGDYQDRKAVALRSRDIMELVQKVEKHHSKAYNILKSIIQTREELRQLTARHLDHGRINQLCGEIEARLAEEQARERHYFASAVTADGIINYIEELSAACRKRYVFKGPEGCGKSTMIAKLALKAAEKGHFLEYYHCGLEPESLVMVIISSSQTALIDAGELEISLKPWDIIVDLGKCLKDCDPSLLGMKNSQAYRNHEAMLLQVQEELENAYLTVKKIKKIYSAAMDYEALDKKRIEIEEELSSDFPHAAGGKARKKLPVKCSGE